MPGHAGHSSRHSRRLSKITAICSSTSSACYDSIWLLQGGHFEFSSYLHQQHNFWVRRNCSESVTSCICAHGYQHFGGTFRFHLQHIITHNTGGAGYFETSVLIPQIILCHMPGDGLRLGGLQVSTAA
jgi:hypothetical protein